MLVYLCPNLFCDGGLRTRPPRPPRRNDGSTLVRDFCSSRASRRSWIGRILRLGHGRLEGAVAGSRARRGREPWLWMARPIWSSRPANGCSSRTARSACAPLATGLAPSSAAASATVMATTHLPTHPPTTLAGPIPQLIELLRTFSTNIVTKTQALEAKVEDLVATTTETDVRLHNTLNEFLMLANTQFIENRVYDDDGLDDDPAEDDENPDGENPDENPDPALVQGKWKSALANGMEALKYKRFLEEEEEEENEEEMFDLYNDRSVSCGRAQAISLSCHLFTTPPA